MRTTVWLVPDAADCAAGAAQAARALAGPLASVKSGIEHLLAEPGLVYACPSYSASLAEDGTARLTQEQSRAAEGKALAKALLSDREPDRIVLVGHAGGCSILTTALGLLIAWAEEGAVNRDPRQALGKIVAVAQLGSPDRAPGAAYLGAFRTEPGQGVSGRAIQGEDVERWLPKCIGSWDEYAVPGDIVASCQTDSTYTSVLWRAAMGELDCGRSQADTARRALGLSQDGALSKLVGQEIDPATLVRTHETLLWPHVAGAPHDRYADLQVFEGATATQRAAQRIAQRLSPARVAV